MDLLFEKQSLVALKIKLVFLPKYLCQCYQNHISTNKDLYLSYVWSFGCFVFLSNGSVIKHRKHNIIWPLETTMEWWERSHIGQAIGEHMISDVWHLYIIQDKNSSHFFEMSHHQCWWYFEMWRFIVSRSFRLWHVECFFKDCWSALDFWKIDLGMSFLNFTASIACKIQFRNRTNMDFFKQMAEFSWT